MLRLQLRFCNGYFAKHLQPFRNCNASKCNCSTFKATQLVAMQFQAMQPQAETKSMATSNICPRTLQQAGAKANADSSTSPSETWMGQSMKTQVQPKCNTIAKRAAWQHQCKRKCNAGLNTNATQVQTQWKTCRHMQTCTHPMQTQMQT